MVNERVVFPYRFPKSTCLLEMHGLRFGYSTWRVRTHTALSSHWRHNDHDCVSNHQITSLAVVYSTVYSDVDQRKHQSSASLAIVWGIRRDGWIPRTKGQLRGKWFHLMSSSCGGGNNLIEHSLRSCSPDNATEPHEWEINFGSENGLVPLSNKPLPETLWTLIYVATWRH